MSRDTVHSAGGVVVRAGESGLEVLVVHRISPDEWRLPKGKIHDGETPEATAIRETREETGALAEVVAPLGDTEHVFSDPAAGRMRVKHTSYFLMRPVSATAVPVDPDFDRVEWLAGADAVERLTFENEKSIVRLALERTRG